MPAAPPPAEPRILFEDEHLLALSKPSGWHVFGEGSLAAWLLSVRPALAGVGPADSPVLAHRLDHETSGLLLGAKDTATLRALRTRISGDGCRKLYLAVAEGRLAAPTAVDAPLGGRHRRSARVHAARPGRRLRGVRPAHSAVVPLAAAEQACLCQVAIQAGMRHQIRAHLALIGHPLWGDRRYGSARSFPDGAPPFLLHAWSIALPHPASGEPLRLSCPPPPGWAALLAAVGLPTPPEVPLDSPAGLG